MKKNKLPVHGMLAGVCAPALTLVFGLLIAGCTTTTGGGNEYRNRGWAYIDQGDYDKAIAEFGEAIRLNPNDANAYRGRGTAYSGKRD